VGETPEQDFKARTHWELIDKLGIVDFDRGARITGAGFPFTKTRVLNFNVAHQFLPDEAVARGYRELQPPLMVNAASATGTGQLPDKEDLMYTIPKDELYLIPTRRCPLTNYHRDELLAEQDLPLKYWLTLPVSARSRIVRKRRSGLNRLHQFDKVELVKFVHPAYRTMSSKAFVPTPNSCCRNWTPLPRASDVHRRYGLYAGKKYDLEVWAIGQERWLEVSQSATSKHSRPAGST